jgi:SAM-dependent methyltransferase
MDSPRPPRSRIYDGAIYAHLMDPLLDGLHAIVADQVAPNQRVLDACCGTGALAFKLAKTAEEVVGVELSPAMVERAQGRLDGGRHDHMSFILGDVGHALADYEDGYFNVATILMALHEMPATARAVVLRELARVAERVLCVDFMVPMPWNLAGLRNRFFEIAAGPEHFGGFRDFTARGGLAAIADEAGLSYAHVRSIDAGTLEIGEVSTGSRLGGGVV